MLGYQEMPISIVEQNGTIGPLHEIQAWLEFSHSETTYCISTQCGWAQASGTKDLGPFLLNSHNSFQPIASCRWPSATERSRGGHQSASWF